MTSAEHGATLFSDVTASSSHAVFRKVPLDLIDADPGQPRGRFDPLAIAALYEDYARSGLLQPLVVEELPSGRYRLIAGERRLRAMRLGRQRHPGDPRFAEPPAMVHPAGSVADPLRLSWQLGENLQRQDLSPGEIAAGLRAVRRTIALERAELLARRAGIALLKGAEPARGLRTRDEDYPRESTADEREGWLRNRLSAAHWPWPEPAWEEVFAEAGLPLSGGTRARVLRILGLADPVLARCDELGLTKNAVAAVASVGDAARQLALLDAVQRAGESDLASPAAGLLAAARGRT